MPDVRFLGMADNLALDPEELEDYIASHELQPHLEGKESNAADLAKFIAAQIHRQAQTHPNQNEQEIPKWWEAV